MPCYGSMPTRGCSTGQAQRDGSGLVRPVPGEAVMKVMANGPGAPPAVRASDADRDRVADVLRGAAGDGRLTADEFDERLEAALSSRTLDELAVLTADKVRTRSVVTPP
jgi:DUF1707 SHOCT-like domain